LNPQPLDSEATTIKTTPANGFIRIDSYTELKSNLKQLISEPLEYFSSMKAKKELGRIIEIANQETDLEKKAEKFLSLIRV
jgi:hypothetical protein